MQLAAQPVMPQLFTDNMVLQQLTDVPVWGQAKPGKTVTVTPSWDNSPATTKADAQGNWQTTLRTPHAGGPYTITVSDGRKRILQNVMVGEVWLCSGQSNMEMPVEGWGHVMNYEQEKNEANQYPDIRLLQVRKNTATTPVSNFETNLGGGWQVCGAETVKEFSATGYFFGRDIHKHRNVPVGLIDASWAAHSSNHGPAPKHCDCIPTCRKTLTTSPHYPPTGLSDRLSSNSAWRNGNRTRRASLADMSTDGLHLRRWITPNGPQCKSP